MPLDTLGIFFAASILLALVPGPDNLFVLSLSLNHGKRAGLIVVAGLCSGLLIHTAIVVSGVAAMLVTLPSVMSLISLLGATYLLYLAWDYWRSSTVASANSQAEILPDGALYRRGFIMNVTNLKVGLFFLAFLPQFIDAEAANPSLQTLLLGLVFILATIIVFGGIALIAGRYQTVIANNASRRLWMSRATSVLFVLLAIKLAGSLVDGSTLGPA